MDTHKNVLKSVAAFLKFIYLIFWVLGGGLCCLWAPYFKYYAASLFSVEAFKLSKLGIQSLLHY